MQDHTTIQKEGKDNIRDNFDHCAHGATGAFADCTENSISKSPSRPRQHMLNISCNTLLYRVPPISSLEQILVGVLSLDGGEKPFRRQSIREYIFKTDDDSSIQSHYCIKYYRRCRGD